ASPDPTMPCHAVPWPTTPGPAVRSFDATVSTDRFGVKLGKLIVDRVPSVCGRHDGGLVDSEILWVFSHALRHGFRQDTAEATSVLSSEATKLAAQGNRDLSSGCFFFDLSKLYAVHWSLSPMVCF